MTLQLTPAAARAAARHHGTHVPRELGVPPNTARGAGAPARGALTAVSTAVLAAAAAATACRAPGTPGPGEPRSAPARVLFFDDFAGPALDRGRWTVRVTGADHGTVNDEQQAYVDDTATVRVVSGAAAGGAPGGALRIRAVARPGFGARDGRRYDFVSGRLDSRGKVEFTYGTAEARMRLPAGAGLWPAFWMLGTGPWPATGEIDVMENVGDPAWVSAALHGPGYSGDTPLARRAPFPAGEDAAGWHVYAADWTPDEIVFRVDAREVYRVPRAAAERYGRWAFDNPKFLILNFALGGGYPRAVNGAGAPYPGLPDASARRLRAGGAEVLVDWVRVTQR
jgi:beta-glucanase (GH16 family)